MKKLLHSFRSRTDLGGKQEDLPYMNRVDAALQRRGGIGAVFLSLGTVGLVALLVAWAAWAELDEVTHGQGQVVAAQRTQVIQHLEGGILREILVREGDVVEKNQLLARLDNLGAASQYRDAMNKALENQVALVRLEAEKNGTEPVFSAELREKAPQIVTDQEEMFQTRRDKSTSETQLLESQYKQRLEDVDEQQGRKVQLEKTLALAEERRDIAYAKVFFRKSGYIARDWYPYFIAARRGHTSLEDEYGNGGISQYARRIYAVIEENRVVPLHVIKKLAGVEKEDKAQFERALVELQMKLYITMCGAQQKRSQVGEEYGWSSTVFCPTELFWGKEIEEEAAAITREVAIERIAEQVYRLNPQAEKKKIWKFITGM